MAFNHRRHEEGLFNIGGGSIESYLRCVLLNAWPQTHKCHEFFNGTGLRAGIFAIYR